MFHFGRAWFFQVFVVVEVELDLLDQLLRQVGQTVVSVAGVAVVGGNDHDFVVHFAVVDKFHHADDFGFKENARRQRGVGDDERVQLVAVFVQRLRDEAVVGRLGKGQRLDAVKLHHGQFAVPFDFVV